jgi:hypothetical protein
VVFVEDLQEAFAATNRDGRVLHGTYTSQGDLSQPYLSEAYQALRGASLFSGPRDITNLASIEQWEGFENPSSTYEVPLSFIGYEAVFCPNGSGELVYDLAFHSSVLPLRTRFYGVSPEDHPSITEQDFNPHCFKSFADKLVTPIYPLRWSHLENARQFDRRKVQLQFLGATEEELQNAYQHAEGAGLVVEPSGAAAVSVLLDSFRQRHALAFKRRERVLIVSTGKGYSL